MDDIASNKKRLTIRLPVRLYDKSAKIARDRGISLNTLIQQVLQLAVQQQADNELYDAFTLLGEDKEACDVDYFFAAMAEVVLADDCEASFDAASPSPSPA